MEDVEKARRKAVRKLLLSFALGFALVAAVVVGALSFLVHRTHQYVKELSAYPENYVLFYRKDVFRPPANGVIPPELFQNFLSVEDSLEEKIGQLKNSGKIRFLADGGVVPGSVAAVRQMEMSFFKRHQQSIKAHKWIAFQILVAFGGKALRRYRQLAERVPFARSAKNPVALLEQIPQENLDLFDKNSLKLLSFRYLWLTAL